MGFFQNQAPPKKERKGLISTALKKVVKPQRLIANEMANKQYQSFSKVIRRKYKVIRRK